jgi:hypothetical protein
MRQAKLARSSRWKSVREGSSARPGSECCGIIGDGDCEAYKGKTRTVLSLDLAAGSDDSQSQKIALSEIPTNLRT